LCVDLDEFDAAIFGAAFFGVVGGDGLRIAQSCDLEAGSLDASSGQPRDHCIGSAELERVVGFLRAQIIGVAGHAQAPRGMLFEHRRDFAQREHGLRRNVGASCE